MEKITLPTASLYILYRLKEAGFEAYLIGGAVRDNLGMSLGYYPSRDTPLDLDFDYTTNAQPGQIMKVFPESFCENDYGTVSVTKETVTQALVKLGLPPPIEEPQICTQEIIKLEEVTKIHESLTLPKSASDPTPDNNYEITTYRVGEKYELDHRHPSQLTWGTKLDDDLKRRDFTINALAVTVDTKYLAQIFSHSPLLDEYEIESQQYQLVDQFHGLADLQANLIKAIGEPGARFREDGLRLMRAVRLSVQLNFGIEEKTYLALKDNANLLPGISQERIRDELMKILASNYPKEGIMLLYETGLLQHIIPELIATRDVAQSGHHLTDVWIHSLDALDACPSCDPLVRLATLLHDVGKPPTQKMIAGKFTFYNHQLAGARMAKEIAIRLRLSRLQTKRLTTLIRHHMFNYETNHTDAAIRRFMRQVGLENLNDILALREGDRLGSNARKTSWRLEEMKQRMIAQLHQPLQVRDLAIGGDDLMSEFQLRPSPVLGRVLNQLLELVLEDADLNTKEKLLTKAGELLKTESAD